MFQTHHRTSRVQPFLEKLSDICVPLPGLVCMFNLLPLATARLIGAEPLPSSALRHSTSSSLRNKRPDLSGRPPCKGVAIGVARRGARLGGERTLRVPPCCSFPVSHPGGPHVVSFVAGRRSCALSARVRAGVARRAAKGVRASWRGKACRKKEEEEKRSAGQRRTKDRGPRQEGKLRACRRVGEYYGGSVAVRAQ